MKAILKRIVVALLTALAAVLLRRKRPKIIAITGSVGKTSTKDAIYAAIKNHTYARKSEKSFNSDIGVPLTVLGLPNGWNNPFVWIRNIVDAFFIAFFVKEYPDILILETGIDRPGDMEKLTKWLKPDIAVLTRLPDVPVHVEYFSSPQAVVEEKMKLVNALRSDGVLVYNADDDVIERELPNVRQQKIGFSRYRDSDFTARGDKVVYEDNRPIGVEYHLKHGEDDHHVFIGGTVGTQHVYSCSAALAVANELGVPLESAVQSLRKLKTPNGRMRVLTGIKGTMIIDDTYNSSPIAAKQALQALGELKHVNRKIVVLGDMLELGKFSSEQHKYIGELVPAVASALFTIGVRSRATAEGALAGGMSEESIFQYEEVARAGRELQSFLQPGDVVLIKASQGIRAERIVEEIMNEPEHAPSVLVRQDKTWRAIA